MKEFNKTKQITYHHMLKFGQCIDVWPNVLPLCLWVDGTLLLCACCGTTLLLLGVAAQEVHCPQHVDNPAVFGQQVMFRQQSPSNNGDVDARAKILVKAAALGFVGSDLLPTPVLDLFRNVIEVLHSRELTLALRWSTAHDGSDGRETMEAAIEEEEGWQV